MHADYCLWRVESKPRSEPLCLAMKQSRLRFKSALRYCKSNEDAMRSNALAKSLMDKDMNSFWRGITKVNNAKIPVAPTVENCVDEPSICSMWKKHYEFLLNSVKSCDLNNEVSNEFTKITEFSCKVSVASITNSFEHLKSGKASGVDGLAAEHLRIRIRKIRMSFLYADDYVNVYLSLYCSIVFYAMVIYR